MAGVWARETRRREGDLLLGGNDDVVLMLLMYGKNERDDLSAEQAKILAALVKEEFK